MSRPPSALLRLPQSIQEIHACCRELATWARTTAEQLRISDEHSPSVHRFLAVAKGLDRVADLTTVSPGTTAAGEGETGADGAPAWILDPDDNGAAIAISALETTRTGLHGRSQDLPVEELMTFLAAQGKTGVLLVNAGAETFRIEFVGGDVVHAASSHAPAGVRLGEFLVENGALTRPQLEAFLKTRADDHSRTTSLLGSALLDAQLVTPAALAQALTAQVQYVFRRLFAAKRSNYSFHEGPSLQRGQRVRLNTTHLLLDVARERDESARVRAA
jgi:hypothetical protein